jgi:hypothetical protein
MHGACTMGIRKQQRALPSPVSAAISSSDLGAGASDSCGSSACAARRRSAVKHAQRACATASAAAASGGASSSACTRPHPPHGGMHGEGHGELIQIGTTTGSNSNRYPPAPHLAVLRQVLPGLHLLRRRGRSGQVAGQRTRGRKRHVAHGVGRRARVHHGVQGCPHIDVSAACQHLLLWASGAGVLAGARCACPVAAARRPPSAATSPGAVP